MYNNYTGHSFSAEDPVTIAWWNHLSIKNLSLTFSVAEICFYVLPVHLMDHRNKTDYGGWRRKGAVERMVGGSQICWEGWRIQFLAGLPRMMAETTLQNWLHQNPDATVSTAGGN